MTIAELHKTSKNIHGAIYNHEISLAIFYIKKLIKEIEDWNAQYKLEEIEMLYKQFITYELKKTEDNSKEETLKYLESNTLSIADRIIEKIKLRISDSYVCRKKRSVTSSSIISQNTINIFSSSEDYTESYSQVFHNELDSYFKFIAFSEEISRENLGSIEFILSNNTTLPIVKMMTVSALTLNILSRYNSDLLAILLSQTNNQTSEIRARIDIALVLILSQYNDRIILDSKNYQTITTLLEDKEYTDSLEYVYSQVVRTYENKSISKKIQNEILPEMMKINSKNIFKIGIDDDDEFNPNWQDSLENSGIGEKLREFGDLQLSGADVYASTFAKLKSYPFFYSFSNWFIPFDEKNIAVSSLFANGKDLFYVLAQSPQLCNSDKHSFFLTLSSMPQTQIDTLTRSMAEQIDQMKEEISSDNWKKTTIDYKQYVRQYIQDMYRFYNLFPERTDFSTPLTDALELPKSYIYKTLFPSTDVRIRLAEFFFEKDCYKQAGNMFETLKKEIMPEADFYQKMGYAYYKYSMYQKAINAYLESLKILSDDVWTLKALVKNYKLINDNEQSLFYLQRLYELKEDNIRIITNLSNQYYELGKFENTLKLLYKLDYLQPKNTTTLRKLLDVLVRLKDINKATFYMNLLLNIKDIHISLEESDWINMAYISISTNDSRTALSFFNRIYIKQNRDITKFYNIAINYNLINILELKLSDIRTLCEATILFEEPEILI